MSSFDQQDIILDQNEQKNEWFYENLIKNILDYGEIITDDRTGVGTKRLLQQIMEFDLSNHVVPMITMKKTFYDKVILELLFFISGKTNTKLLEEKKCMFWKSNTSREFLDSRGLHDYPEGSYGPNYGFNWRHCGAEYDPSCDDYKDQGIDQLQNLIDGLKKDPFSRRHIMSVWIPDIINKVPLPPCHIMLLMSVTKDGFIDSTLIQRSGDMFLGVPFNIASYSILIHMICHLTGYKARKFLHLIQDAHVYLNHIDQCKLMLTKNKMKPPTISFDETNGKILTIDDFNESNIKIHNYVSNEFIKAPMAV